MHPVQSSGIAKYQDEVVAASYVTLVVFLCLRLRIDAPAAATAVMHDWVYLLPPLTMAACLGHFAWLAPPSSCAAAASAIAAPLVAVWVVITGHAQLTGEQHLTAAANHSRDSQQSMLGNNSRQPSLIVVTLLTIVAACLVDCAQWLVAASRAASRHLPPLHRTKLFGQTPLQPQLQPQAGSHLDPVTCSRTSLATPNQIKQMCVGATYRCVALSLSGRVAPSRDRV